MFSNTCQIIPTSLLSQCWHLLIIFILVDIFMDLVIMSDFSIKIWTFWILCYVEKHLLAPPPPMHPNWGSDPQPRHVPPMGIELATHRLQDSTAPIWVALPRKLLILLKLSVSHHLAEEGADALLLQGWVEVQGLYSSSFDTLWGWGGLLLLQVGRNCDFL